MTWDEWIQVAAQLYTFFTDFQSFQDGLQHAQQTARGVHTGQVHMFETAQVTRFRSQLQQQVQHLRHAAGQAPVLPPGHVRELWSEAMAAGIDPGPGGDAARARFYEAVVSRRQTLARLHQQVDTGEADLRRRRRSFEDLRTALCRTAVVFLDLARVPTPASGTSQQAQYVQLNHDMYELAGLCAEAIRLIDTMLQRVQQFRRVVEQAQRDNQPYERTFHDDTERIRRRPVSVR